jgi:hypothetical protein
MSWGASTWKFGIVVTVSADVNRHFEAAEGRRQPKENVAQPETQLTQERRTGVWVSGPLPTIL